MGRRVRLTLIFAVVIVAVAMLAFVPPVPLGAEYHHFADNRTIASIPNCLDVLSNIPFIFVGAWGVFWLASKQSTHSFVAAGERRPYLVFFAGVAFTGLGSLLYHLAPGDARLPWDLLPMACSFMAMVAALIGERIGIRASQWLLVPLIALGISSVAYWCIGERKGGGDLRFYLFVEFFPAVFLAWIVLFFPPRYSRTCDLATAFVFFALAKVLELGDREIYSYLGFISGHALKHLVAALSCFWILRMLWRRKPVESRYVA